MGVGPAETERVDTDHQFSAGFERLGFSDHTQVEVSERNVRIELLDADGGGHLAFDHAVQRLHQTGDTRGCLKVPDVAFDRTDQQWLIPRALLPQRLTDSPALDRIADWRARTVSFQVVNVCRTDAGTVVGLLHQGYLRIRARDGQTRLSPIGISRTAGNDREDLVCVLDRLVVILQIEKPRAFRTDIAICRLIEHMTLPRARQH
ncbi:hypothetical protein D3C84_504990 [compost metagenome]